MGKLKSLKKIK